MLTCRRITPSRTLWSSWSCLLLLACGAAPPTQDEPVRPARLPGIAAFTADMTRLPGFVTLLLDADEDRLYLHLPTAALGEDLLYTTALASGLGSNPVGLDRGSLGPQHVVAFERRGPRVLVLARNLGFRATSDNPRERQAVAESFAPAVLAALPVAAADADGVVVEATEFFVRDATGAADRLRAAGQGSFRLERERSALWLERTRAFPDNTEVEVLLTFTCDEPGALVRRTAASGGAVTLRQHHSLVRLPGDGFRPRRFDPRVGYSGPAFVDYGAPLGAAMHRRFIARHRLEKRDATQAIDAVEQPIVYYIDPGVPEPIRSALQEGAMWWADAFAAAGFRDAFRVELLPADADPMDVRYNMIHWVHRRTRGWSYGASVVDPRTGEILKGNVLLGSLRVRQDHLKLLGLDPPYGDACAAAGSPDPGYLLLGDDEAAQRTALARIRQLAAHEVGHTLGLTHNFAASSYGRASVMDYPAPLVEVRDDGSLDFDAAYGIGVGAYDRWAIRYGYAQFPPGSDEEQELAAIVREGLEAGHVFLTDQDARDPATAHPLASLWDNGSDPLARLETEYAVRAAGLRRFGVAALRPGATLASLEDALVPLYLHHRFQLEAALKFVGGVDYRHAVKGDGQPAPTPVPAERQRRALQLALQTLAPEFLQLDPRLLARIPPAAPGHPDTAERFPRTTGQPLDPVALATACADVTIRALLEPERLARLSLQTSDDDLTLHETLDALVDAGFGDLSAMERTNSPVERAVQNLIADRLIAVTASRAVAADVHSAAELMLQRIAGSCLERQQQNARDAADHAHQAALHRRLQRFLDDAERAVEATPRLAAPPGSPIGSRN